MKNEDFQKVDGLCRNSAEKTFAKTRQSHLEKLEKLFKKNNVSLRPEGASNWVINRTQRDLTKAQEVVLALDSTSRLYHPRSQSVTLLLQLRVGPEAFFAETC